MTGAQLTFAEFESHCLAYLSQRDATPPSLSDELSWRTYATGWTWPPALHPGVAFESTACLERSFPLLNRTYSPPPNSLDDQVEEEDDPATTPSLQDDGKIGGREVVTVVQTIAYSRVWRLPVLHFHAYLSSGDPVPLEQLAVLNIVHATGTLPQSGEQDDQAQAAISVGDHPRTGLPSYFLHPCHTNAALSLLLQRQQDEREAGYMASFISLCASAVEMRAT